MNAMQMVARQRSPEETQRAYRAFQEDVGRSPWALRARRLLECETPRFLLHADGTMTGAPHSPELLIVLDQHALYVREVARRHGFEVPV